MHYVEKPHSYWGGKILTMSTDVSEFMLRLTSNWQLACCPDQAAQAPSRHRRTPHSYTESILFL